jgi:hypothetical protein
VILTSLDGTSRSSTSWECPTALSIS